MSDFHRATPTLPAGYGKISSDIAPGLRSCGYSSLVILAFRASSLHYEVDLGAAACETHPRRPEDLMYGWYWREIREGVRQKFQKSSTIALWQLRGLGPKASALRTRLGAYASPLPHFASRT